MELKNNSLVLTNAKIILEEKTIEKGTLIIEKNKISKILDYCLEDGIDLKNNIVLPGFIDCHIHGGYGVDFEIGGANRFSLLSNCLPQEGITSYIQASVTNSIIDNNKYTKEFGDFFINQKTYNSKCLGLHLEGPFLSKEKCGAHDVNLLIKPNIELVNTWNKYSNNAIKIISYAPELQDGEFTKYCLNKKIIPSAGHSNINSYDFKKHYKDGINHITHLLNGMSKLDNGLALASLNTNPLLCEIISDGIHLTSDLIKLIYNKKGIDNICIITDSINAKNLKDGEYTLGKLDVIKNGIKIFRKDNKALAGSGATYIHNVKTFFNFLKPNLSLNQLIKATSINIAKQLNIFDKVGEIAIDKIADLVIINNNFDLLMTIINGKIVYKK